MCIGMYSHDEQFEDNKIIPFIEITNECLNVFLEISLVNHCQAKNPADIKNYKSMHWNQQFLTY